MNKYLISNVALMQPYFIAEATMPGKYGFDFNGASQSFNVLAEYLFGKVSKVFVRGFENCLQIIMLYAHFYCLLIMSHVLRIQQRREWR